MLPTRLSPWPLVYPAPHLISQGVENIPIYLTAQRCLSTQFSVNQALSDSTIENAQNYRPSNVMGKLINIEKKIDGKIGTKLPFKCK